MEDGHGISRLILSKNCLGDEGVTHLAACLVGSPSNALRAPSGKMDPKVQDGQVQHNDRRQKSTGPGAGSAMEMSGQEHLKLDKPKHTEGEPSEQGANERRPIGDDSNINASIPNNS